MQKSQLFAKLTVAYMQKLVRFLHMTWHLYTLYFESAKIFIKKTLQLEIGKELL